MYCRDKLVTTFDATPIFRSVLLKASVSLGKRLHVVKIAFSDQGHGN